MKSQLLSWLLEAGLSQKQAIVYLSALSTASGDAREIADHAKTSRTGIYEYLDQLAGRGFLREVKVGKHLRYVALHPKELLKRQLAINAQLKDLLPDFLSLFAQNAKEPFVQQFEGLRAARELYEDILASKVEEYQYISSLKQTYRAIDRDYMKDWVARRVKKGIRSRSLRIPSPDAPTEHVFNNEDEFLRQIRFLPAYVDLKAAIYLYGNNVGVLSAKDEQRAYIIYSPDFAQTMHALFELLWSIGVR